MVRVAVTDEGGMGQVWASLVGGAALGWLVKVTVDHFLQKSRGQELANLQANHQRHLADLQAKHQRELADRESRNRTHEERRVPALEELYRLVQRVLEAAQEAVSLAQVLEDHKPRRERLVEELKALWDFKRDNLYIPDEVRVKVEALFKLAWISCMDFVGYVIDTDEPSTIITKWNEISEQVNREGKALAKDIREHLQRLVDG